MEEDVEKQLKNKEVSDALHMLLHCSLKDTEYETQRDQFKLVYNYIQQLEERNQDLYVDIKIGEYVRDCDGYIIKVNEIKEDEEANDIWLEETMFKGTYKSMVIKHSPNITDLIEIGDIIKVKGIDDIREVINDNFYKHYNDTRAIVDDECFSKRLVEFDIEQILTKEKYKIEFYKVK